VHAMPDCSGVQPFDHGWSLHHEHATVLLCCCDVLCQGLPSVLLVPEPVALAGSEGCLACLLTPCKMCCMRHSIPSGCEKRARLHTVLGITPATPQAPACLHTTHVF
jgi:hypothetical protein